MGVPCLNGVLTQNTDHNETHRVARALLFYHGYHTNCIVLDVL